MVFDWGSHWATRDRVAESEERCGEGRRDRALLAEAHAALGWVRFFVDWKFAEGLSELKRAKELSPANPTANDLLARVIVYLGQVERPSGMLDMRWNSILFLLQRKVISLASFSSREKWMRQMR